MKNSVNNKKLSVFSSYTMLQERKPNLGLKFWRYDLVWLVAVFCVLCNPVNGFFCFKYSFSVPCPLVELLMLVLRDPGRIWNSNYTNQIRNLTSRFFGTWNKSIHNANSTQQTITDNVYQCCLICLLIVRLFVC